VLRPDGVSVQLASPGADALGRGGMGGEVDRHFATRFGGSILLSVLNAGVSALSRASSAQVYIGSTADAANVAAAAFNKDGAAPPTIRTPQGAAVRVFVARDLDFSGVPR
jgi:type IV secretion system protein VirB10